MSNSSKIKIAIVGSGISGLSAAMLLHRNYAVTLFEAKDYFGGHSHTVEVVLNQQTINVDTGFIVFNKKNYPKLTQLFEYLDVEIAATEMSFSFYDPGCDFEYNGHNLNTLFSQRRNLLSAKFYSLLYEITQFNKQAKKFLDEPDARSVQDFLNQYHFSQRFRYQYFLPMSAAIWSCEPADVNTMPALFILQFLNNHGLLNVQDRPQWYTVVGGSQHYVGKLMQHCQLTHYIDTPVLSIARSAKHITIKTREFSESFDKVVIATHSDQALQLLELPTDDESNVLKSIGYRNNQVILHTDQSVMPKQRRSWASWNYCHRQDKPPLLTYYMNRLQPLATDTPLLVSLNASADIDPKHILASFDYAHPLLNMQAIAAQKRFAEINGKHHTHYCGAYWGHGFHEDGINSAYQALQGLKIHEPW